MPVITFIFFLIFLALLMSSFRQNADVLSPGRVFGMLWCFVLALVELKLSWLQVKWNLYDWFMALLPLGTFLIGIYLSFIINLNKPFLHVSEIRRRIRNIEINEKRLFIFIVVYFLLCLTSFIIEWQVEGYIPIFTDDPNKARVMFGIFGLNYIVNSVNVVLFLIIQYFIFIRRKITKKSFLVIIFILSMGNYILFVQRYLFFVLLMMALSLYYYSSIRIRLRTFLIFIGIVTLLIVGIQSLRATELVQSYIIIDSKMKLSPQYAGFAIPYMYISMNVENFVKYYSEIKRHSFGFFTFEFLIEASTIRKWFIDYYHFDKVRLHIGGYNTYPFYWPYYYDFGITGLALIPFIVGFLFSELYYKLHRNPTMVILVLNAIAFGVIIISFNSDPLTRLDTVLNFVVIVLAQFFFINKPKTESGNLNYKFD